jgi:hypothetical protein
VNLCRTKWRVKETVEGMHRPQRVRRGAQLASAEGSSLRATSAFEPVGSNRPHSETDARGLSGVALVTRDSHPGLVAAIGATF